VQLGATVAPGDSAPFYELFSTFLSCVLPVTKPPANSTLTLPPDDVAAILDASTHLATVCNTFLSALPSLLNAGNVDALAAGLNATVKYAVASTPTFLHSETPSQINAAHFVNQVDLGVLTAGVDSIVHSALFAETVGSAFSSGVGGGLIRTVLSAVVSLGLEPSVLDELLAADVSKALTGEGKWGAQDAAILGSFMARAF